jgi:hypothetical protein
MSDHTGQGGGSLVGTQIGRVADSLDRAARAVRNASKGLEEEGYTDLSRRADALAGRVQGASDYLRESDLEDLARDTRLFIRTQPVLSLAAACAVGLLLARFLKSSRTVTSDKPVLH